MGCCGPDHQESIRNHEEARLARVESFQKAAARNDYKDALHHFGKLLVFYEVGTQGLQLKRKASRNGRHKLDAELEVFSLCTVPPGLGCSDRAALYIARFWSRFTERLMPLPCRGKQASLGGARALYAATGAISSVIINIIIFIIVCILSGAPAFMYGQIIWILITKPLWNWIPAIGAFLNFTGQPVTRSTNRIETLLMLRSAFRHHDDSSQFKNEKGSLRWELDVAPDITITYGKTFLEKIAGRNARQVSKDAEGGGCCCCSCC